VTERYKANVKEKKGRNSKQQISEEIEKEDKMHIKIWK